MATSQAVGRTSSTSGINLGIVCPMANERATAVPFIEELLGQCNSWGFKSVTFFAVLDRASRDGTLGLLRGLEKTRAEVRVVWSPENRCVVDAYVRGYREALGAKCDWILEVDAGYSHQPSDIPQFFEKMLEGYECVFGSRFCAGGRISQSSLKRRIVSRGGTLLTNLLLDTKLKDMTSGFQLFTRAALQEILDQGIHSRGHFFQTEIKVHAHQMRITEVPIHYRAASDSVNNKVLKDAFSNLWRLFRLRFSDGWRARELRRTEGLG